MSRRKHSTFYRQFSTPLTTDQRKQAELLRLVTQFGYAENPSMSQAAEAATASIKVGLRLGLENVPSNFVEHPKAMTSQTSVLNDATKLAQASQVLHQLSDCVGELRSAGNASLKVAAALAGAVRLAQDGLIDCADIFQVAQEAIVNGTVKLASLEEAFSVSPGELTGPPTAGTQMDPLTATLRHLRGGG